jgi:hypothetical protein
MSRSKNMKIRRLGNDWRMRVNAAFVQYSLAGKANRALGGIQDESKRKEEFQRNFKELAAASHLLHAERQRIGNSEFANVNLEISKPLDGEVWPWPVNGEAGKAYVTNPESDSFFRTLVFLKYGLTFRELVWELEQDPQTYRKWIRVHEDFYRFRWGKASLDDLKLKFKLTHFQIIVQGLDFGLKELNEWELADCLDEICPCAQKHSAEYLKKLRTRIINACRTLGSRNALSTTSDLPLTGSRMLRSPSRH